MPQHEFLSAKIHLNIHSLQLQEIVKDYSIHRLYNDLYTDFKNIFCIYGSNGKQSGISNFKSI